MSKLADAHIEQAKTLRAEGMSVPDIAAKLTELYSVDIKPWQIYAALKGEKPAKRKYTRKPKAAKRKYTRKPKAAKPEVAVQDNIVKEIVSLLGEIQEGYKKVFKHLRTELLRSRAEVCEMLAGAGIPAEPGDV